MATPTNLPSSFTDNTTLPAATLNNLRGAFRVLQLFSVQGTTQQLSTSTGWAEVTGLTVTITPQSATNKILIISTNSLLASLAAADGAIRIMRGATNIFTSVQLIGTANVGGSYTTIYLDEPTTTSATTYKIEFRRDAGTGNLYSSVTNTLSNLIVAEISA
jgi:hypothetical protein